MKNSFIWLNFTQFFGALNDNIFKFLVILLLIQVTGDSNASNVTGIAGLFFVAPFLLFSHAGGVMADKYSKKKIIVGTKLLELLIMAFGIGSLYFQNQMFLYFTLFLMASQSAIFGPSKYGIIPEIVPQHKLSQANSQIVTFTFMAIIFGTAAAPFLTQIFNRSFPLAGTVCLLFACIGLICSSKIETTAPQDNTESRFSPLFLFELFKSFLFLKKDKQLLMAVLGTAYFMIVGTFVQLNIIPFGMEVFELSKEASTYLFIVAAFGIGTGSFLSGKLSGRNIEFGIVPIGALGITLSAFFLWWAGNFYLPLTLLLIFLKGVSAGLFIVPLESFIQFQSPENRIGEIKALSNFLGFIGVLLASIMIIFFTNVLQLSAAQGFLTVGLLNLILLLASLYYLPDFLLRFIALVVMHTFYRISIRGIENLPIKGGALLVSNHVSWIDALLLVATTQRRIRFLMDRHIYQRPFLKSLFKLMGIIPVSMTDSPKKVILSLKEARKALDEGYLVCIFVEGQITRSGQLSEFRRGYERIVKGSKHPIIPIYIGGAWGSIFSYCHGEPLKKLPLVIPYPVNIYFGDSLPADSDPATLRLSIMDLSTQAFQLRKFSRSSLGTQFIATARENWLHQALADSTGKRLSYGQTLIGALYLKSKLSNNLSSKNKVAVLLPPSIGGALSNIAVSLLNKVTVNINFTSGQQNIESALKQCEIKDVITSKRFLKKVPSLKLNEELNIIYLEDILSPLKVFQKISFFLKARLFPVKWLNQSPSLPLDQTATIIFSSGSTSEPKGIELSHHNISSNIESLRMIFDVSRKDCIMGCLPFFHSFGYTVTLWFPLLSGFKAFYHPSPLDSGKIIQYITKQKISILVSTPTFLNTYSKKAKPDDFASLRYVITGAEKLKEKFALDFFDKFGIQILEGYGATELSPIASTNLPDVHIHGVKQKGLKKGSVGQAIPGVSVKIVNPDNFETCPFGEPGLLLVKGPNVMKGYLNRPDKTAEVISNGWYNTGDIAKIDKEGFITITDRLSRFSKIGGEMVPHVAIEDAILSAMNGESNSLSVTSVSDDKKGEILVLLFTSELGSMEDIIQAISEVSLPNLWKPRKENLFQVDEIPLLGTGKIDLKALKLKAEELKSQ